MAKKNHLQDLINKAAELEDQTQVVESQDFDYEPPPAGITVGRLVDYIEVGVQKQRPFAGKPKKPAEEVRVTFELLHPKKNIKEIEVDGEKRKIADRITLRLKKSFHEKASFRKLFDKMRYGRDEIKHMAQMLGEGFIITITHNKVPGKDGKPDRVYANITNEAGEYTIQAPFQVDAMTEKKTEVPVPPAISDLRVFLFDLPTKETWDSLFIDGDRTKKDKDGNEVTVSKNWIQDLIRSAENFKGSAVASMLEGSDELPDDPEELEDDEDEEEEAPFDLDDLEETEDDSDEDEAEEDEDEQEEEEEEPEPEPEPKKTKKAKTGKKSAKSAETSSPKGKTAKQSATSAKTKAKTASPSKKAKTEADEEDPLAALGLM